jgi:hypothetical protein
MIGDGVSEEGGPHWEVPYSNWGYPGNPQLPPGRGMVSYPPYLSACTVARKGVEPLFGAKLLGFAPSSCCSERRKKNVLLCDALIALTSDTAPPFVTGCGGYLVGFICRAQARY